MMKHVNSLASFAMRALGGVEMPPARAGRARIGHGRRVDRADMERLLADELSGLPPLAS